MKKRKITFCKLNNRGAGIVTVIIAVAMVSILCSIILTTSYMNYKMKVTNYKTKDTFYTAESALDEIRLGLEEAVSDALSSAYLDVLAKYNQYSADEKNAILETQYYENLGNLLATDASFKQYDISKVAGFVKTLNPWHEVTETGLIVSSMNPEIKIYDKEGFVLKNLEIYYRDSKGYSTYITTDIRLASPKMDFAAAVSVPDVKDYIVINDGKLTVNTADAHPTNVTGNVYSGNVEAVSPSPTTKGNVVFDSVDKFVVKKDVLLTNSNVSFASTESTLWADDFILNGSAATVNSNMNLADDINLKGVGSKFSLFNKLVAYGTSTTDSTKSSAILINGQNSELDFSGSEAVVIAGHAFIDAKKVHNNPSIEVNNIYTGESVAVKSNQLMYMVPAQLVGVYKTMVDGNPTYGESKFSENPITATQYEFLKNNGYEMVYAEGEVLPGKKLKEYTDGFQTVFVQTNGETMVYFYINFKNEEMANQYFKDYYAENSDRIKKYVSFYANAIDIPDEANMVQLKIAGNYMEVDGEYGDVDVRENTLDNASARLSSQDALLTEQKKSLTEKLLINIQDESVIVDANSVYTNLINTTYFNEQLGSNEKRVVSGDKGVAVIANGDYTYNGADDKSSSKKVNLIVANGNVTVQSNFDGLIIAKGDVSVKEGLTLTYNADKVVESLSNRDDEKDIYVYSFFRDGSAIARSSSGMNASADSLALSDLVIYENWKRN